MCGVRVRDQACNCLHARQTWPRPRAVQQARGCQQTFEANICCRRTSSRTAGLCWKFAVEGRPGGVLLF